MPDGSYEVCDVRNTCVAFQKHIYFAPDIVNNVTGIRQKFSCVFPPLFIAHDCNLHRMVKYFAS